jgi:hypothetical protein
VNAKGRTTVETCEIALREAARIINVVRERRVSAMGEQSVIAWSDATASRGVQSPAPALGLEFLRELQLVTDGPNGNLLFDLSVAHPISAASSQIERFPRDLIPLLLNRLMGIPVLRMEIGRILVYCAATRELGWVEWRLVPRYVRENPAWLWLQKMGAALQTEKGLVLDRTLLPYIAETLQPAIPLSQADLDARLILQRERGALAEALVVRLEKERLSRAGFDYLAEAVVQISVDDVCAGYDVRSFETTGQERLIEVKSSAGPRERFYLSENERATAEANGASYWLAWVGWGVNLPDGDVDICWVRNLAQVLGSYPSPWRVSVAGTVIDAIEDDAQLQTRP